MNREIERAIKRKTGLSGIKVHCGGGVCRFVSDEPQEVDLSEFDCAYVPRISILSPSEWAREFEQELTLYRKGKR